MTTANPPRELDEARAANQRRYGTPSEARAYADDLSGLFCEDCHGIYHALPGYVNDGHQCDADGTQQEYEIG